MLSQVNSVIEIMLEDPKFLANIAKLLKRMHDELVSAGFTSDQACAIVANFKATGG